MQNYSSLDSFQPAKIIPEKDEHASNASIVSEIDQTIKKHVDDVLHALDTVSARLTQLESRTRNLENSLDGLKVAAGNNYGSTDGKMRQLENILREVLCPPLFVSFDVLLGTRSTGLTCGLEFRSLFPSTGVGSPSLVLPMLLHTWPMIHFETKNSNNLH